jgi:hypothetical protein
MRLLLTALARTPLAVLYAYGWVVYAIAFHVLRWRRDQVAADIALAFPDKTPAERADILRKSYRNLADVVMETIWGLGASAERLKDRVVFENPEVIERGAAAGQSVVLLAPHFCNWEWLLSGGGVTFELPIDAVYQTLRVRSVDRYLREARSRFGGKPIPREDFVYELMNRAGTPRGYALIADQTPPRYGVFRRRGKGGPLPRCTGALRRDASRPSGPLFGAVHVARRASVRHCFGAGRLLSGDGRIRAPSRTGDTGQPCRLVVAAEAMEIPEARNAVMRADHGGRRQIAIVANQGSGAPASWSAQCGAR